MAFAHHPLWSGLDPVPNLGKIAENEKDAT